MERFGTIHLRRLWGTGPQDPQSCAGGNRAAAGQGRTPSLSSFYYNKARLQLQSRNAQRLTSFIIRHFWLPVGGGVKSDSEVDWILSFILGDQQGVDIARRIDATIAKLPGLRLV